MPIALFLEGGYPFLLILYGGGVCLTMVPLVWGGEKKSGETLWFRRRYGSFGMLGFIPRPLPSR